MVSSATDVFGRDWEKQCEIVLPTSEGYIINASSAPRHKSMYGVLIWTETHWALLFALAVEQHEARVYQYFLLDSLPSSCMFQHALAVAASLHTQFVADDDHLPCIRQLDLPMQSQRWECGPLVAWYFGKVMRNALSGDVGKLAAPSMPEVLCVLEQMRTRARSGVALAAADEPSNADGDSVPEVAAYSDAALEAAAFSCQRHAPRPDAVDVSNAETASVPGVPKAPDMLRSTAIDCYGREGDIPRADQPVSDGASVLGTAGPSQEDGAAAEEVSPRSNADNGSALGFPDRFSGQGASMRGASGVAGNCDADKSSVLGLADLLEGRLVSAPNVGNAAAEERLEDPLMLKMRPKWMALVLSEPITPVANITSLRDKGYYLGAKSIEVRMWSKSLSNLAPKSSVRLKCSEDAQWLGLGRGDTVDVEVLSVSREPNFMMLCSKHVADAMPRHASRIGQEVKHSIASAAEAYHQIYWYAAAKPWPCTEQMGEGALAIKLGRQKDATCARCNFMDIDIEAPSPKRCRRAPSRSKKRTSAELEGVVITSEESRCEARQRLAKYAKLTKLSAKQLRIALGDAVGHNSDRTDLLRVAQTFLASA
jgi:hypothetical protein